MSKRGIFRFILSIILLIIIWVCVILNFGFIPFVAGAFVCAVIFMMSDYKFSERKKLTPTKKVQKINVLIWPATVVSVLVALYVTDYLLALAIVLTLILPAGIFLNDKYQQR
ncbi:hypothetical protein [Lactococcus allomyrinae]|uniref:Uncharacterized protein n=1 Tax=Lactococcus allomyrinae TaxID=2419773 RepID=A0A387BC42_9LACT|nr:hypothetical protein [Lactococcus allomyrinae]AYG01435.1 hypothetical protein D7I46_10350 [Lactococcus allomyrinae]